MNPPDASNGFWSTCARATDFELCSAIASAVEDKYGYSDGVPPNPEMPLHERVPFLIWYGSGFAEKEGLLRMLMLPFDRAGWADAYEMIGHPDIAESLRFLTEKISSPDAQGDEVKTNLQDFPPELEKTEALLFSKSKEVVESLAQYSRHQIERYESMGLDLQVNDGVRLNNTGYLGSAHSWIWNFACKHEDRIPTLEELLAYCMHDGIKSAGPTDYEIPLSGKLAEQEANYALIILRRPVFGQIYCITVAGRIRALQGG